MKTSGPSFWRDFWRSPATWCGMAWLCMLLCAEMFTSCRPFPALPQISQAEAPALPGAGAAPKTADEADQLVADLKAELAGLESKAESLRTAEHDRLIRRWCYAVAAFFGLALIGCGVAAFFVAGLRAELLTGAAASAAVASAALWGASHVELVTAIGAAVVVCLGVWVIWRFHNVHVSRDALLTYTAGLQASAGQQLAALPALQGHVAKLEKRAQRLGLSIVDPQISQADPPAGAASKAG